MLTPLQKLPKNVEDWGAAIAQWIRLRLPSCRPGFESQAHHPRFYHNSQYVPYLSCERNKKRPDLVHFKAVGTYKVI